MGTGGLEARVQLGEDLRDGGVVPAEEEHGTYSRYVRQRCRCLVCKAWNAARQRAYRAAVKANYGLPLGERNRMMPSLMTRLRRDVGIVARGRFAGE